MVGREHTVKSLLKIIQNLIFAKRGPECYFRDHSMMTRAQFTQGVDALWNGRIGGLPPNISEGFRATQEASRRFGLQPSVDSTCGVKPRRIRFELSCGKIRVTWDNGEEEEIGGLKAVGKAMDRFIETYVNECGLDLQKSETVLHRGIPG